MNTLQPGSTRTHPEPFVELTRALPSFEYQCLTVLAALGVPLNRTRFADLLRKLQIAPDANAPDDTGLRRKPGRAAGASGISTTKLGPMLERWEQLGLIDTEAGNYVCRSWSAHTVLSDTRAQPLLLRLREAWQTPNFSDDSVGLVDYELRIAVQHVRRVRIAVYLGQRAEAEQLLAAASATLKARHGGFGRLHSLLFDARGPGEPLGLLTPSMRADYLRNMLPAALRELVLPSPGILREARLLAFDAPGEALPHACALAALGGTPSGHADVLARVPGRFALEVRALLAL